MATVRTTDVVYRHDASSFCVLLPATADDDACAVANRIRGNVEKMPLLAASHVTVSVGVATGAGSELAVTIDRADQALASGATRGGNRVHADVSQPADADASPAPAVAAAHPSVPPTDLPVEAPFSPPSI